MHFLFLFLDGIGLGADDPSTNPLAGAHMPNLQMLLGGARLVSDNLTKGVALETERASLLALDANLGVDGLPQSATGQAALLTGINIPAALGYHYGPKPNPAVAEFLRNSNLFNRVQLAGLTATFLNAYPPRYFEATQSGLRMYSAIPLAVTSASLPLKTAADLYAGNAISADFTGQGWRDRLEFTDAPLLTPAEAGKRMAWLAMNDNLAFFEYWPSDYAGHRQEMEVARALLETFDSVLGGLLDGWDGSRGLILVTSDHGNLEDLSTRRHTRSPVPALVIGSPELRRGFTTHLQDLTDVTPAILRLLT